MKFFLDSVLFSYSQIFFCNRKWFGAVTLLSTFIVPELGALALLGVLISNSLALYLEFDRTKIRNGFYGFNGILFGTAAAFYFEITPFLFFIILIFMVITFFVSSVLENYMAAGFNLPGFSLPFIITLYIFIIFLTNYDFITLKNLHYIDYSFLWFIPDIIKKYFQTMALIIFQPSLLTGIIITVAVLFFSRVMFTLSVFAFALNYILLKLIIPAQFDDILILAGFNSILTAFALGGNIVIISKKSLPLVIISTVMVIIITGFFIKLLSYYNLPVLVLPFNFIVLSVLYSLKFRQEQSDLALLYFQPGSPEENYYYHRNRKSRFENFKFLFPELPFFGEFFVPQGFDGKMTHREEWKYAWDFVITDEMNKEHSDEGISLDQYYAYKIPVVSPLDGKIVKVVDGIPDNPVGEINLEQNWGNTVITDHGEGLFSSVSHLEADSIKVAEGDEIKKGKIIGLCGNSGRSPSPHIHFQFQATDKLGDKTIKFPFAYFLERKGGKTELKIFDYPAENTHVQPPEIHSVIKKAFKFRLGDMLSFSYARDGKEIIEKWEVKVDTYSTLFIENSFGETAHIYLTDKIFYLSNYIGKRNSALYYFYLLSAKVPLCFNENLAWNDEYQLSKVMNNFTRYISEFFLLFREQIKATGVFAYESRAEEPEGYCIRNKIEIKGSGIFSFYRKEISGSLKIDRDGNITGINISGNNQLVFSAKPSTKEER